MQTGLGTSTLDPVGVRRPVSVSTRKDELLPQLARSRRRSTSQPDSVNTLAERDEVMRMLAAARTEFMRLNLAIADLLLSWRRDEIGLDHALGVNESQRAESAP